MYMYIYLPLFGFRAQQKVNWLSEYWLTAAYLAGRSPTASRLFLLCALMYLPALYH